MSQQFTSSRAWVRQLDAEEIAQAKWEAHVTRVKSLLITLALTTATYFVLVGLTA